MLNESSGSRTFVMENDAIGRVTLKRQQLDMIYMCSEIPEVMLPLFEGKMARIAELPEQANQQAHSVPHEQYVLTITLRVAFNEAAADENQI